MQERDEGRIATAKVEAVVPVRTQSERDAVGPDLGRSRSPTRPQVVVHRARGALDERRLLIEERDVPVLLDVLRDGGHEPEVRVRGRVLQPVDRGRDRRGVGTIVGEQ